MSCRNRGDRRSAMDRDGVVAAFDHAVEQWDRGRPATLRWGCGSALRACDAERAAVLMGAAAELSRFVGSVASFVPGSSHYHDECDRSARADLGAHRVRYGLPARPSDGMDEAVAHALGKQPTDTTAALGLVAAVAISSQSTTVKVTCQWGTFGLLGWGRPGDGVGETGGARTADRRSWMPGSVVAARWSP